MLDLSRSGMKRTLSFWGSFVIFRRSKGRRYVKLLIQHKLFFVVRLSMSCFFYLNVVVKRWVSFWPHSNNFITWDIDACFESSVFILQVYAPNETFTD